MKTVFILIFTLSIFQLSITQDFVEITTNINGLANSSSAWGDFDNDDDLDLLIAGTLSNGNKVSLIYRNDNGVFSDINAGLPGMEGGSVEWGDVDNDNDLDILLCGENETGNNFLFLNEAGVFTQSVLFEGDGMACSGSLGDYNNDGFLDVLITGNWSTALFRNSGDGSFFLVEQFFPSLANSSVDWGDFDRDGDLDILLGGDTGGGMKTFVFENVNGYFTEISHTMAGLGFGKVTWGDYDSDGDLDVIICGFNDYLEPQTEVYNNYNKSFDNIYAGIIPVALGEASIGDVDNDGDDDILIMGKLAGCGVLGVGLFLNDDNYFNALGYSFQPGQRGSAKFVDVDNDGDLDVFLSGQDGNNTPFSKIFINEMALPQVLPTIPEQLSVIEEPGGVWLQWASSEDFLTPSTGLAYNIVVHSDEGQSDILSPQANMESGFKKIISRGNSGYINQYRLTGLEAGKTYHWKVQAVDKNYAATEFSAEHSFQLSYTGIEELGSSELKLFSNPCNQQLFIQNDQVSEIIIFSLDGKKIVSSSVPETFIIDVDFLQPGMYIVSAKSGSKLLTQKMLKL